MLRPFEPAAFSQMDELVFDSLVLRDHYLRRADACIDFIGLRETLSEFYNPHEGRPGLEPVLMVKLEFLQYHDNLSDREVIKRAQTDVAYRWFLGLGLTDDLPVPSLLTKFRGRIGVEGHKRIFQIIVGQAREHGLVKDRLRIKDATHVIADIDVPSTLALVAHARDRLLAAASSFDMERVEGERARLEAIRISTEGCAEQSRLSARLTHLSEILEWVSELPEPDETKSNLRWKQLLAARKVAAKVLGEADDSKAGDRTKSVVDPDARRGRHGDYFDGYLVDVMIDAGSELFTAINVLPANGNEALDAVELIKEERDAHGNDIETVSIDGVGFNGPVLRELESKQGLNLDVIVPPPVEPSTGRFTPDDFVVDAKRKVATCPAGKESQYRQRDNKKHTTVYRFSAASCASCPLMQQCLKQPPQNQFGRTVRKNDYQVEYDRVRKKATTEKYDLIRSEHPKVERKLSELVRRHGARRARYRGRFRVLVQQLLAGMAANIKRMVLLLGATSAHWSFG